MDRRRVMVVLVALCAALAGACSRDGAGAPSAQAMENFAKGKAAYLKQELKVAEAAFSEALAVDDSMVNAWVMLGKTRYFLGEPGQAEKDLRRALAVSRDHVEALYYLARISLVEKATTRAAEYLERILETDPHNARASYSLGVIHSESRDYQKAFTYFNKALEEESMLARIRHSYAEHLRAAGLRERAREMLRPALQYATHGELQEEIKKLWAALQ